MAAAGPRSDAFNKWCVNNRTVTYTFMTIKKTTTKKVTLKKVALKKSVTKKEIKKEKHILICAQGEQCFWTTDGTVIANLVELEDALSCMADEVFSHHVHAERNDFANWIADILQDGELAESLRIAKKPSTAHTIIVRRLKQYDI